MTSASINTFVGDLVAMAQAQEQLPIVTAERDELRSLLNKSHETVAEREVAIIGYKAEIEALHARLHAVETERDDALLRVMEMEDRSQSVVRFLRNFSDEAGLLVSIIDPPKPEPVAEAVTTSDPKFDDGGPYNEPAGERASDPTPPNGATNIPITENGAATTETSSQPVPSADAMPTSDASSSDPAAGPDTTRSLTEGDVAEAVKYRGVNYWELPGFIDEASWAAGGGDMNNYRWGSRTDPKFTPATPSTDDIGF